MWIKSNDEYVLEWNGEKYPLNKGITELPNDVAEAYFFTDKLKQFTKDVNVLETITKIILQRWDRVIMQKKGSLEKETTIDFVLDNFAWANKRDELELTKK